MSEKSIKKNFVMNAILTISGFIFPLISFPYVTRVLGPTGTGRVDFALSFVSYFSMIACLGIPYYGIRICAQVRDDKDKLSRTVRELMVINAVMSLISIIVFIPFLFFLPKVSSEKSLYIVAISSIPLYVFGIEYLYKGLEQYSYITIRSVIIKLISLVSLFVFIHDPDDYVVYGAISVFAGSASWIFNFIHSRRYIQFRNLGKCDYSKHIKPILTFFAMSCALSLYAGLDKVMLGFMTGDDSVGYYGASIKIKSILVALVTSLGNVLMPRASYCVKQGNMSEFNRLLSKAMKFVFVAALPLLTFFMLFASDGILFVAGREYLPAIPAMQFIMPTVLFIGLTGLIGVQIFIPLGKEKYVLYSEIAGAITDLLVNALLIPKYQATGAAVGTLIAEFAVLVVQLLLLYRIRSEVSIIYVLKQIKYWKIIISCLLATLFSIVIIVVSPTLFTRAIHFGAWTFGVDTLNSFIRLLFGSLLFFGCYSVSMIISKDEIMLEVVNTAFIKLKRR